MWDLKLQLFTFLFSSYVNFESLNFFLINIWDPFLANGLIFNTYEFFYECSRNMSFFFACKFVASIAFLILIRGGTPRYRYDYLTKLGWLKFLTLVLAVFSTSLLNFFLY